MLESKSFSDAIKFGNDHNFPLMHYTDILYFHNSEHSSRSVSHSELYGKEYDQVKVTYNDIYFQQKSL